MILNYSTELKLVYDTLEIELMLCCNHINTEHRLSVIKYFFHSPVIMMFLRENQGMILQPDLAGKVMFSAGRSEWALWTLSSCVAAALI